MQRTQYLNTTTAFTQMVLEPLTNMQGVLLFQHVHHLNNWLFFSQHSSTSKQWVAGHNRTGYCSPFFPCISWGKKSGFVPETQCMLKYYGQSSLSVSSVSVLENLLPLTSQKSTKTPFYEPGFSPKFQVHNSHSCWRRTPMSLLRVSWI